MMQTIHHSSFIIQKMNLQPFITSGILELYVTGLTTPEETREVEEVASQHPEVQAELDDIRSAMESYAVAHRVQPPEGLKDKILSRLHDTSPKPKKNAPAKAAAEPSSRPIERERKDKMVALPWLLGLVLLGALVAAFVFFSQAAESRQQAAQAQAQFEQLKKECDEKAQQQAKLHEQFIALRHWATKPVQMKGTKLDPSGFAVVYHNTDRGKSYLNVVQLPALQPDKQYQLWALVGGQPKDLGVFNLPAEGDTLLEVPFVKEAEAFAVTLEPKGGSPSPTLDQMHIYGEVGRG